MTIQNHPQGQVDDSDDRRNHLRLDKASGIRYQTLQNMADQGAMKDAELCDFGGGGIRFLAPEPFDKNEQLVIELHFDGWQEQGEDWVRTGNDSDVGQLNAIGAVMWCADRHTSPESYEIGLRFTGRVR